MESLLKGRTNAAASAAGTDAVDIITADQEVKTDATGTDKVQAPNAVDLAVRRGELVAVMGPSGCGKTTQLNCLSGLDDIDSGQICLEGNDFSKIHDRECTTYRARRMGFIFQVYNLLPVLSTVENIEVPLLVTGVNPNEARVRTVAALDETPSGDAVRRPTAMCQIARSRMNNSALIWARRAPSTPGPRTTPWACCNISNGETG